MLHYRPNHNWHMRHTQGMDNALPHLDVLMPDIPKQNCGHHQRVQIQSDQ